MLLWATNTHTHTHTHTNTNGNTQTHANANTMLFLCSSSCLLCCLALAASRRSSSEAVCLSPGRRPCVSQYGPESWCVGLNRVSICVCWPMFVIPCLVSPLSLTLFFFCLSLSLSLSLSTPLFVSLSPGLKLCHHFLNVSHVKLSQYCLINKPH